MPAPAARLYDADASGGEVLDRVEPAARRAHLQQAESDFDVAPFDVVPFDADSARAFGAVAASLRASGRKSRIVPHPDGCTVGEPQAVHSQSD
jgi:predicted nucleic acid-binding protein